MLTKAEMSKCIVILEAVFGQQPKAKHDIYFELLESYAFEDLKTAATRCATELRQYPTIKDIIDRIPSSVSIDTIASRAWDRLVHQASYGPSDYNASTGSTPNMRNCDPRELEILRDCGGVSKLASILDDQASLSYMRREFIQHVKQDPDAAQTLRTIRNEYIALHPIQEQKQIAGDVTAQDDVPHVHEYTPDQIAFRAAAEREYKIGADGIPYKVKAVDKVKDAHKDDDTLDTQDW